MSQPTTELNVQNALTAETIQTWLMVNIAEQLGVTPDEIDVRAEWESYGLDSAQAMLLASRAEKLLGIQLSPLMLLHYPTIEALSQRLAEEPEVSESEFLEI